MKRKGAPGGARQPSLLRALGAEGSRFVECPCCGKSVAIALVSFHLDTECSGAATPPPPSAPAPPLAGAASPPRQQQHHQPESAPRPEYSRRPGKEPVQPEASSPATAAEASPTDGGKPAAPAGTEWWRQKRPAVAATGFKRGGQQVALDEAALFAACSCELVPDFLPAELAEQALRQLIADSPEWEQMRWWVGGREEPGVSSKTSCHYLLAAGQGEGGAGAAGLQQQHQGQHGQQQEGQLEQQQQGQQQHVVASDSSAQQVALTPPSLQLAAEMAAARVTQRIAGGAVACLPLEEADRHGWAPSYAGVLGGVANRYADGSTGIGAHSDRLTSLGPLPIIASLTLGATRTFRLHRQQQVQLSSGGNSGGGGGSSGGGGAGSSAAAAAAAVGAEVVRVDLELPHNALLVMWPPCQECWKHEIPKTAKPFPTHRLSGAARFNLTYRRHKPEWEGRAPHCRCGRRAVMKARQPRAAQHAASGEAVAGRLSYFYCCDSTKGPPCGFFADGPSFAV